jgi:hypothetical protein
MSKAFFDNFFPAVSTRLQLSLYTEWLYRWSLPDETAALCPDEPILITALKFGSVSIHHPILCCHAIAGVWIGIYGAQRILKVDDNHDITSQKTSKHSRHLWAVAFAAFAAMNIVAIPLHSCRPESIVAITASPSSGPATILLPTSIIRPWLWALDTYCTGASASAICLATFSGTRTFTVQKDWLLVNVIGIMGMYTYLQLGYKYTLPLELWYLVPTVLAAQLTLLWLQLLDTTAARQTAVRLVAIGITMVAGILLDPWFCSFLPHYLRFWDLFTGPANVFLGCNLAFVTLLSYLVMEEEEVKRTTTTTTTTNDTVPIDQLIRNEQKKKHA